MDIKMAEIGGWEIEICLFERDRSLNKATHDDTLYVMYCEFTRHGKETEKDSLDFYKSDKFEIEAWIKLNDIVNQIHLTEFDEIHSRYDSGNIERLYVIGDIPIAHKIDNLQLTTVIKLTQPERKIGMLKRELVIHMKKYESTKLGPLPILQ